MKYSLSAFIGKCFREAWFRKDAIIPNVIERTKVVFNVSSHFKMQILAKLVSRMKRIFVMRQ